MHMSGGPVDFFAPALFFGNIAQSFERKRIVLNCSERGCGLQMDDLMGMVWDFQR